MAGFERQPGQKSQAASPETEAIQQFFEFFLSTNTAPASPTISAPEIARLLQTPLLNQQIFANSFLAIIDQSNMKYVYMGPAAKDFTGHETSVLMEKGMGFLLEFLIPEDLNFLLTVFPRMHQVVASLPIEKKLYTHFYYNFRLNTSTGINHLHQQTIPLALNDRGENYLVLAVLSNVSEFKKDNTVHYKLLLKMPGAPVEVLAAGNSKQAETPLTKRETEITQHLSDGKDSQDIADQLFISQATVRTHRKNILEKTGAKNVAHLVQLALANGWI
jgi:DNA-binding CsgD family transcriptional regulator